MGQNYSSSPYKKSYRADYVKSYKSGHVYVYEPPTVEKKQSKDAVLAEGSRRTPRPEAKEIDKTKAKSAGVKKSVAKEKPAIEPDVEEIKPKAVEPKPRIIVDIPYQETKIQKEELPPLFDPEGVFNKKGRNADPEIIKYPVKHLHGTTYLDIFSGREINEERARDLLHTAGFTPKTGSGMLPVFLSIAVLFFFGYFGLVPLILTGFWLFKKDNTTYTKVTDMEKLSFSMPATKYEMMIYKFQAIICFIVAVVSFVARVD
jgi:hypothetical protein